MDTLKPKPLNLSGFGGTPHATIYHKATACPLIHLIVMPRLPSTGMPKPGVIASMTCKLPVALQHQIQK